MKINQKNTRLIKNNTNYTDNILLQGNIVSEGDEKYIYLQYTPKQLILYKEDGAAKIINNPSFTSGRYNITDTEFTHVYYVPGETFTVTRAVNNLGLEVPLNPNASISDWTNLLNLKLAQTERDLSIWESYNIYKVAYNIEDLSAALASLPLSSSVLVNIDSASVNVGSWLVKKGDVICRDYEGTLHHIPGSNGGFYFPSAISLVNGTVFELGFQFSTETPIEGSPANPITEQASQTTPYTQMSVEFPSLEDVDPALCYAYHGSLGSRNSTENNHSVPYLKDDDAADIEPIVYYYLSSNNIEERVYLPTDYKKTDSSFLISNPTMMTLKVEVR